MTIREVINQLESLKADAVERIDPEDEDDVFLRDVQALDIGIQALTTGVHGKWKSCPEDIDDEGKYPVYCSECDYEIWTNGGTGTKYCPNCGAKMD